MATNSNFNIKNGLSVADQEVIAANGRVYVSNTDILRYTQAAFDQANTGGGGTGGASTDTWARVQANAAFTQANAATNSATSSYGRANSAFTQANSATTLAQAAYNQANTGGGGGTSLPSQSGHAGEYLQTDGSTLSWSAVSGGGGLTPYSDVCLRKLTVNKSPSTAWRSLGNADQISYVVSTYFEGLTPSTNTNSPSYAINSANNVFITAPCDAPYSPDCVNCYNQMWLVFSSGSNVNFANTSIGQKILALTPGQVVNAKVKYVGSPWNPDVFCVPLTVTVAPQDLFSKVQANSSPSSYFSFCIADDPNNWTSSFPTCQYTCFYNPYCEANTLGSSYLRPGQKIIVGFCNPPICSFSAGILCNVSSPYDWNFSASDNAYGTCCRSYWPYVFAVRNAAENWWINNNWNGITTACGGILGGTIARIENPCVINQLLTYNGNIGADNGNTNFGTVSLYNSTSNNVVLTSSNITSTFTTSNTLQAYVGTNFDPGIVVGRSLKITENPLANNVTIDGDVYKTLKYQSLGSITGTYSTPVSLIPRTGATTICISNQQAAIYQASALCCTGAVIYTNTLCDGSTTQTKIICGYPAINDTKNIVFAPYNSSGDNRFSILNLSSDAISNLQVCCPVQFTYLNNCYNACWVMNFVVTELYTNNTYCFGDNVWGCCCTNPSWCNARLCYTSGTCNGTALPWSTLSPTESATWSSPLSNFKLSYAGTGIGINVSSTGTVTTSNTINIDNTNYSLSSVDSTNNTIVLAATYNANINLIGSVATTNTYFSKYGTMCDIDNKLTAAALDCVISARAGCNWGGGTGYVPNCYVLKSDGCCPSNMIWSTLGLNQVVCTENYTNQSICLYSSCAANDLSTCRSNCNNARFGAGALQITGGLGVGKGIWTDHIWANTSLESRLVSTENSCVTCTATINNLVATNVCIPKTVTKYGDTNWTSVTFLSLGTCATPKNEVTGCNITNQSCSNLGNSTIVPPGATGYSICVGSSNYVRICNPNSVNVFNGDFTVETWLQNPTDWPYWGYSLLTNNNGQSAWWACWSNGGCVRINNTSQMSFTCQCIYTAFFAASGLNCTGWNHWALSRQSGCLRYFLNGSLLNATTCSTNEASAPACYTIGYSNGLSAAGAVYLYNYRITSGCARYTANFTPSLNPYGTTTATEYANTTNNAVDVYGGIKMTNMCYVPTDTYSSGGYLYIDGGALKYKGSSGTVTTLGSA